MKYKHIVFDIDGTLLDSEQADLFALKRVILELQGREYEINKLRFALGIPSEVALTQLGINDISKGCQLWNIYMKELADTMSLFSGIRELIIELKTRGFQLGIITSKNRNEYRSDFIPFGIDSYFDTVITVEDCVLPKPSAEPMLSYLQKTESLPQEVIYIGDTSYDWKCANNAGVDFGLAMWGSYSTKQINALYSFKTPEEFLIFLISDGSI